ncbi:glycine oxidase ThiO [Paenibacillus sp. CAU 1782]
MSALSSDTIVLGGGIIGLSCAFEAARRGRRVTLLESGNLGGQASGAAAGMLAPFSENTEQPDPFFQLSLESLRRYPDWIQAVEEVSGIKAELMHTGSLSVIQHEADLLPAQGRAAWQNKWGAGAELIQGNALRNLEPNLSRDVQGAIHIPSESHVYAPKLVEGLITACRKLGDKLIEHAGGLAKLDLLQGGGVTLRMANLDEDIHGQSLLVCSGAWTGELERWLGIRIPVHPIRGQICSFRGSVEEVRHMVFSSQAYWVGKQNGEIVCGASEDVGGFTTDVTEKGISRLTSATSSFYPFLNNRVLARRWAGLRPATRDGYPLLGKVKGNSGVIMAAGHYRNGILLSPVTAKLVVDELEGRDNGDILHPFCPNRFTAMPPERRVH